MTVPCGRCIGCRLARRREMQARQMHEMQFHDEACFLTLTDDDEHAHPGHSIRTADFQSFMKRLRSRIAPKRVRFMAKGEYGRNGTRRGHWHANVFGWKPSDLEPWKRTPAGVLVYKSEFVNEVWGRGSCTVGDVTLQSAGYVANHNVDKLNGQKAKDFYERVDPETGEVFCVEPERALYSTNPGIGRGWLDKYESDVFPTGFVVLGGNKFPAPRYYKKILKDRFEFHPSSKDRLAPVDDALLMSRRAKVFAKANAENSTPERLEVREKHKHLSLSKLKRDTF